MHRQPPIPRPLRLALCFVSPLAAAIALSGCDSLIGNWAVDVEETLAGIEAVPPRAQADYSSLDEYRMKMRSWLKGLSLDVAELDSHEFSAPGTYYSFIIHGYFSRNPLYAAVRVSEEPDGTRYEVWHQVSALVYEKEGHLEWGAGKCVWHRRGGAWPIRFQKR